MARQPPKKILAKKGAVAIGSLKGGVIQIINNRGCEITEREAKQCESLYLNRMIQDCASLEWLRLVRKQDEDSSGIQLDSIYTALLTDTLADKKKLTSQTRKQRRLSALEMLNQERKLVLTGEPGSGKSSFINYVALCLAGDHLKHSYLNLAALTEPLPNDKVGSQAGEVDASEQFIEQIVRQQWDHGALIPLRIILRDFSSSRFFTKKNTKFDAGLLMQFIKKELKEKNIELYYDLLRARLEVGEVLVLFDGLDEVPETSGHRKNLLECLEGFFKSYSKCRFLVTCRPYAYQNSKWKLSGFIEASLARFGKGQIKRFVNLWYIHSQDLKKGTAKKRASKLNETILSRPEIFELASRPLLLGLITYLHSNRYALPDRRAELYERLLDLLIDEWERARFRADDVNAASKQLQLSLAEFLQIGKDSIRLVLQRLAFQAQTQENYQQGATADISAKDLIFELFSVTDEDHNNIGFRKLCEYLRDRVGILYKRGGNTEEDAIYAFPHRSFQEFLAAEYFRREEDKLFDAYVNDELTQFDIWQEEAAYLGRNDPGRWREVIILLGGINAQKNPGPVWSLVESLIDSGDRGQDKLLAWGVRLASEIAVESLSSENLGRKHLQILEDLREKMRIHLGTRHLPPVERAAVGCFLSKIGDSRKEVSTVDDMHFCLVPKGPFHQAHKNIHEEGYDNEVQRIETDIPYNYWIARFPVTVAQFKIFVSEVNCELEDPEALSGYENHPVCRINCHEALAFCRWVTERWQKNQWLGKDRQVDLPSISEWHKAAVGGLKVPINFQTQPIAVISKNEILNNQDFYDNELPNRTYPWGNSVNTDKSNYSTTKIKSTSTVGCFPRGAGPYGTEELSGNVWEWVRADDLEAPSDEKQFEIKGGSFQNISHDIKNFIRQKRRPVYLHDYLGFRLAIIHSSQYNKILANC